MSINRCDLCYHVTLKSCNTGSYTLPITLTPSTAYVMWMEDIHNNIYQYWTTSEANGKFVFDTNYFPDGMFNAYSGPYDISFSTSNDIDTGEGFEVDSVTYHCLLLDFKKIDLVYD